MTNKEARTTWISAYQGKIAHITRCVLSSAACGPPWAHRASGGIIVIARDGPCSLSEPALSARPCLPTARSGDCRYRQLRLMVRNVHTPSCALALYCVLRAVRGQSRLGQTRQGSDAIAPFCAHRPQRTCPRQSSIHGRSRRTACLVSKILYRSRHARSNTPPDFRLLLPRELAVLRDLIGLGEMRPSQIDHFRNRRSCTISSAKSGSGRPHPPA